MPDGTSKVVASTFAFPWPSSPPHELPLGGWHGRHLLGRLASSTPPWGGHGSIGRWDGDVCVALGASGTALNVYLGRVAEQHEQASKEILSLVVEIIET